MEFEGFPKMARLSREVIITEKLDGTNAQVCIGEDGSIRAGSRTRWITPADDNFGFSAWVEENRDELLTLGPGRHFGEWWGMGIQRGYGLRDRRFSLFNADRWAMYGTEPTSMPTADPRVLRVQKVLPPCCDLVPVLARGVFDTEMIVGCLDILRRFGSAAAPGYANPEGIIVYHTAANFGFKKTLMKDDQPKGRP